MPDRRILDSLAVRLMIALAATVAVVLSLHAALGFHSTRGQLVALIRSEAHRSSGLIRRATHDGMLLNQLDEVQVVLQRMAAEPEVHAIRVYDKDGRIALSAEPAEVGRQSVLDEFPCSSCHPPGQPVGIAVNESAEFRRVAHGERVLRVLSVLPNEAGCARSGCHESPDVLPILGVLDVEMSLAPLDSVLAHSRQQLIGTTVILLLVTGAISWLFVRRWVHRPASRLYEGTRRVAAGELGGTIEVAGRHELARLAEAFNRMTADLSAARVEIEDWSSRLEEKVLAKTEEVRRAQRHVLHVEKMASLGQLAATVAHELNNPLSGIGTYARLVQRKLGDVAIEEQETEELRQHLEVIRRECARCGEIVRNLLLFARDRDTRKAPLDLGEVLDHGLQLVRHHLEMHNVGLESDLDLEDPMLHGDQGQLEQAFVALFVNAVEAIATTGTGGLMTVRASGPAGSEEVVVEVEDCGVGIPSEQISDVFQPFFSTKRDEAGVGLGLAVVYGIVRRHGGHIDVESELGRGTSFRVVLPRRPSAPEADGPPGDSLDGLDERRTGSGGTG